jgi:hypothetical protein
MRREKQDSFRAHDEAVRARTTEAFRQRRRLRNGARAGGFAVIAVAALLIGTRSWQPQVEVKDVQLEVRPSLVGSSMQSGTSELKERENEKVSEGLARGNSARDLNDDELLAIFPEGSCFLAEVNGRKTLVFHDPAVRAKFFN